MIKHYPKEPQQGAFSQDEFKLRVRHGVEKSIEDNWKNIIREVDPYQRKTMIDALVKTLQENCEQNGFIGADEKIPTIRHMMMNDGVKFDDPELYYVFFDKLAKNSTDQRFLDDEYRGIASTVLQTVQEYFGRVGQDTDERKRLTQVDMARDADEKVIRDANGDIVEVVPSVGVLRGKNLAQCAERAAASHNLMLLLGKPSYLIESQDTAFNVGEGIHDSHAFVIFEPAHNDFRMFDPTLNNYCSLSNNPIQEMLEGKPLVVNADNGVKHPGVYANNSNITKSKPIDEMGNC